MRSLRYTIGALAMALLCGCQEDDLQAPGSAKGEYQYCFHATIASDQTRVSVSPDDSNSGLDLHWEEGDVIVLTPDGDDATQYEFKAVSYIYNTEAQDPVRPKGDSELGENEILVYFFEYQGDREIQNAGNFYGTATYRPSDYQEKAAASDEPECKSRLVLTQEREGDSSHLRKVESLSARLEGVDLAKNPYSWVKDNEWENNFFDHHDHVVFEHTEGCYAFLKVILHGFKYSIWGGGTVNVYIMDETPDMVNDEYVPDAKISFGNTDWENSKVYVSKSWPNLPSDVNRNLNYGESKTSIPGSNNTPFIDVPEYWELDSENVFQETKNAGWFDSRTQHYTKEDVSAVFYVPIDPTRITGGNYIDVVLQDGWSGDLYVWQKKVPYTMQLEAGKMYTLDYRDKRTEYALKIVDNSVYFRSTYLEQDKEGVTGPINCYDIKGNLAEKGKTSVHPNRFAFPSDPAYLTASDVEEMRNHHGAFYASTTPMAGICRTTFQRFAMNADGSWAKEKNNLVVITTTIDGEVLEDNVRYSKEYMQKITKGYMNTESSFEIGKARYKASDGTDNPADWKKLCIEYILDNRFDPVMKSSKTSNLWRAPYGRDLNTMSDKQYTVVYPTGDEKYLTIQSALTGHRICLPYVQEFAEKVQAGKVLRGTKYDGSDGNTSTWDDPDTPYADWRFTGSRSVRSFGTNNPAYFQTVSTSVMYKTEGSKGKAGMVNNFSQAYPILPVFKWRKSKTSENERIIPWSSVTEP